MSIESILNDPKNSFLLYLPGNYKRLLLAAPHHSPIGVENLPCESHPTADENTGWIAYRLSKTLDCGCLVAGNYYLDPNKHKTTDYYKKIEQYQPEILVEIHGHGSVSANFDIEISSGSRNNSTLSEELANQLAQSLSIYPEMREYTISGDFDHIHFKATKSLTINTDEWTAYHIELPQSLRQSEEQCRIFCDELSKIIPPLLG